MTDLHLVPRGHSPVLEVRPVAPITLSIRRLVGAAGPLLGAGYAASAGLMPTGDPRADIFWSALFGGALAFVASRAQPVLWIACSLLTILASTNGALVAGYGLALAGLWGAYHEGFLRSAERRSSLHLVGRVAGVLVVPVLLGMREVGPIRTTAAIGAVVFLIFAAVAITGLRPEAKRRVAGAVAVGIAALALAGFVSFRFVTSAESNIRDSQSLAESAIAAIRAEDLEGGFEILAETEESVAANAKQLSGTTGTILGMTPGVGHNIHALRDTIVSGRGLLAAVVDFGEPSERLGALFDEGRVDAGELGLFQADARHIAARVDDINNAVVNSNEIWLAPPLMTAMTELQSELSVAVEQSEKVGVITDSLPAMLGMDGPRRYLVLFGNPAEARELGGFTGATAVLDVNDGALELSTVERRAGNAKPASVAVLSEAPPVRFLEHRPWVWEQNYSAMADFPTLSRALEDIYPAMGGTPIDGVIYLDPFALQAVMAAIGPVNMASLDRTVEAAEIPDLLLVDQYELYSLDNHSANEERDLFFTELFEGVASSLKSGELTLDASTSRGLLEMVRQDRLLLAPLDEAELAAADALGLAGRIAPIGQHDYLAVSHLNAGANKLDPYLQRAVTYDVSIDPVTEELSALIEIELENSASPTLPAYVAGSIDGRPGTTRVTLVVHSPHDLVEWDGLTEEPELVRSFREFDRWRHEAVVVLGPRESRTVQLRLAGRYSADKYVLDIGHQPLVNNDHVAVIYEEGVGESVVRGITLTEDVTLQLG